MRILLARSVIAVLLLGGVAGVGAAPQLSGSQVGYGQQPKRVRTIEFEG